MKNLGGLVAGFLVIMVLAWIVRRIVRAIGQHFPG